MTAVDGSGDHRYEDDEQPEGDRTPEQRRDRVELALLLVFAVGYTGGFLSALLAMWLRG